MDFLALKTNGHNFLMTWSVQYSTKTKINALDNNWLSLQDEQIKEDHDILSGSLTARFHTGDFPKKIRTKKLFVPDESDLFKCEKLEK